MGSDLKIASVGTGNTGNGKIGYVVCISDGSFHYTASVPQDSAQINTYCKGAPYTL